MYFQYLFFPLNSFLVFPNTSVNSASIFHFAQIKNIRVILDSSVKNISNPSANPFGSTMNMHPESIHFSPALLRPHSPNPTILSLGHYSTLLTDLPSSALAPLHSSQSDLVKMKFRLCHVTKSEPSMTSCFILRKSHVFRVAHTAPHDLALDLSLAIPSTLSSLTLFQSQWLSH